MKIGGDVPLPLDIVEPELEVNIVIREDGRALWVNADGQCVCRIGRIPTERVEITINDLRDK